MNASSVNLFCKQATCPSAEMLLSFGRVGTASEQGAWIRSHLASCDFCSAELQLLSEHSPVSEDYIFTDIPRNLRSLAEALLGGLLLSRETFTETAYEKERLTLTDA